MLRKFGIALCLCGMFAASSVAEDTAPGGLQADIAELREELSAQREDLQRRLEELERRLAPSAAVGGNLQAGYDKGKFFLESADGDYRITFGGRIHFHGVFPLDGPSKNTDDLVIRRIRTVVEGHLARFYEFKIEYDFGRERQALTDGFLNLAHLKEAQFRMGKFKVPFSVEELTSSNSIRFVERSLVSRSFAPSRLIGASVHGKVGSFGYETGVFDGSETGRFLYAGRVSFAPVQGISLGANAYHEHNDGRDLNAINYSTERGTELFRYAAGTASDGHRTTCGVDVSYWGTPLGLVGEYIVSRQNARRGGDTTSLTHDGLMVQASYVLTGENATARGLTPKKTFEPANGGWGALELAARYAVVNFDSDAFPTFATGTSVDGVATLTLGLNWYLNRNMRIMFNYVQSDFDDRIDGHKREEGILARVQLAF